MTKRKQTNPEDTEKSSTPLLLNRQQNSSQQVRKKKRKVIGEREKSSNFTVSQVSFQCFAAISTVSECTTKGDV